MRLPFQSLMFVPTKYGEIMISIGDDFVAGDYPWKIIYFYAGIKGDKILCEMDGTGDGALFTPEEVAEWTIETHEKIDQSDMIL